MKCPPAVRQSQTRTSLNRLKPLSAVGAWVTAMLLLSSSPAWALALGRVTVQSNLGEPLRAEIDIAEISSDEAGSLLASLAPPQVYRATGTEYPGALGKVQISLRQRADKRYFLQVSNEQAVNEPYVDLMIEVRWGAGRLIRDYALLLNPPPLKDVAALSSTSSLAQVAPIGQEQSVKVAPVSANESKEQLAARSAGQAAKPTARKAALQTAATSEQQIHNVRPGDTASKIARAFKPARVSLDQMLIALLRTNPQAFVDDNINRIKSGAQLRLPTEEQVLSTPAEQARGMVLAQSKDFNEFRRNLAGSASKLASPAAKRQADGQVQAKVLEDKVTAATPDKLTLAKSKTGDGKELNALANNLQKNEEAQRIAEINKNIESLKKVSAAASGGASQSEAPSPGIQVQASPAAPAPAPSTTSPPPSAPVVPTPAAPAAPASDANPSSSPDGMEAFLRDPLVIPAAGVLLALLGALGFYKNRQRKALNTPFLTENKVMAEPVMTLATGMAAAEALDNDAYGAEQTDAAADQMDVGTGAGQALSEEETPEISLDDPLVSTPAELPTQALSNTEATAESPDMDVDLEVEIDLDLDLELDLQPGAAPDMAVAAPAEPLLDLDMELDQPKAQAPTQIPEPVIEMANFDFGGLSLELEVPDDQVSSDDGATPGVPDVNPRPPKI